LEHQTHLCIIPIPFQITTYISRVLLLVFIMCLLGVYPHNTNTTVILSLVVLVNPPFYNKQIIGPPPILDDLVDPIEECEVGDSPYRFEGGDAKIVAVVLHEMAAARGEIIELDDEDDEEDDKDKDSLARHKVINLCTLLEKACIRYGDLDSSLELPHHLCRYRAQLQHEHLLNCTQSSLDSYFTVI
jgi:hypothetical protein